MILKRIQQLLEEFYQFSLKQKVEDFLLTQKPKTRKTLSISSRQAQEALLIRQRQGDIELALFIDERILKKLEETDPFLKIGFHNLEAFCTAVEGVSHFLYFLKGAAEDRPLTQLELEIQAEIDKYLMTALLYFQQTNIIPEFLFPYLFENFKLDPQLKKEESLRYAKANLLATKFCAQLKNEHLCYGRWHSAIEKARHFYHLNHWAKIRALTP